MLIAGRRRHLEDDVDQGRGLGNLPVDAGGATRDRAQVDDKVSDRAEAAAGISPARRERRGALRRTSYSGSRNPAHRRRDRGRRLVRMKNVRERFRGAGGVCVPMRAMPLQLEAARSVGGVLASPISWVWYSVIRGEETL